MKNQVLYIHGGESYKSSDDFYERLLSKEVRDLPSNKHFSKWTKKFAENLGSDYELFMPQMPNAENAKYREWKIWFERHFQYLNNGVILVGCSLGGMFLLKYFGESKTPFTVKALFILAAATSELGFDVEDCGDFVPEVSLLGEIGNKVGSVKILHSKDDFLVPYAHALVLQKAISLSELITFEDKNHFIIEEFLELVEEIRGVG